jgi:hypothetical protein
MAPFIPHKDADQQATGQTDGQSEYIDGGEDFVLPEIPECDSIIKAEHSQLVLVTKYIPSAVPSAGSLDQQLSRSKVHS